LREAVVPRFVLALPWHVVSIKMRFQQVDHISLYVILKIYHMWILTGFK
jgi:hypothetical protein